VVGLVVCALDDWVEEEAFGDGFGFGFGEAGDVVAVAGGDVEGVVWCEVEEVLDGVFDGLGCGVHDAGEWVDLDGGVVWRGWLCAEVWCFEDWVCEEAVLDGVELVFAECCFDEVDACDGCGGRREADGLGVFEEAAGDGVAGAF